MKHLIQSTIMILGFALMTVQGLAQSLNSMSYQAVIRNTNNELVENQMVGIRISIIQGSPEGPAVYVETHNVPSNINGLISLAIGNGIVISGDMDTISWGDDTFFIKTETDPNGGVTYTITGTNQLLTVPYAMHAKTATSLTEPVEETDPTFNSSAASDIEQNDIDTWNNMLDNELDPAFQMSPASGIEVADITNWDAKLDSEVDPTFQSSPASNIAQGDIDTWNNMLNSEVDPTFQSSDVAGIDAADIANWDGKVDVEVDPTFQSSPASGIESADITNWDAKLDSEVDPAFQSSPASSIAQGDIDTWNNMLDNEVDPTFQSSDAAGIDAADIANWDGKLDSEVDPVFTASPASAIVSGDITNWDNKLDAEVDGDVTNELQQLTVVGDTIFISDGNFVVLPGLSYLSDLLPGPSAQDRIDGGETPLEIYNSDNTLLDSLYGCSYAGGLICYFDPSDGSGLVCNEADLHLNMHWYNCFYTNTGATLSDIGTGAFNTGLIIADQGGGFYAASVCDMNDDGGFEDWFLPSRDELEQVYLNLHAAGKGGFGDAIYWSSTEESNTEAISMDFSMGTLDIMQKLWPRRVRGVRVFN
jgi:hypothetical protein